MSSQYAPEVLSAPSGALETWMRALIILIAFSVCTIVGLLVRAPRLNFFILFLALEYHPKERQPLFLRELRVRRLCECRGLCEEFARNPLPHGLNHPSLIGREVR